MCLGEPSSPSQPGLRAHRAATGETRPPEARDRHDPPGLALAGQQPQPIGSGGLKVAQLPPGWARAADAPVMWASAPHTGRWRWHLGQQRPHPYLFPGPQEGALWRGVWAERGRSRSRGQLRPAWQMMQAGPGATDPEGRRRCGGSGETGEGLLWEGLLGRTTRDPATTGSRVGGQRGTALGL